jgi:hypothetical protein
VSTQTAVNRAFPLVLPVVLLALVVVPWVALELGHEQYSTVVLVVVVFLDVMITYRWWHTAVYLYFLYVLVEGFIINYFFGYPMLNGIKDVQLLLLFSRLALFTLARHSIPIPFVTWTPMFLGFSLLYFAQIFNPHLPSILVGIVGLRVTLLYFLCFGIAYWFFKDGETVMRFLRFHAWASFPVSIFGIVQYFTGPSLLLAISPGFNRAIFYVIDPDDPVHGSHFRTISTFASTSGFSQYLWVAMLLTLALLLVSRSRVERVLGWTALGVQACALLSTGSRGPAMFLFLSMAIGYGLAGRLTRGVVGAISVCLLGLLAMSFLGARVATRLSTVTDLDMMRERNEPIAVGQMSAAMDAPIEGLGAGRLCSASLRLYPNLENIGVENQLARIRVEAGLFGVVLFGLAAAVMLLDSIRAVRSLRNPVYRSIGGLVASFPITAILSFPLGLPLDISPTNFYFWFLLGLLYALLRIERREAQRRVTVPVPSRQLRGDPGADY